VIVEGYAEYATWRPHLAYLRDPYGDPDMEMEIDGVGGVSILAKAKVFRSGVHFPAFSFEKHAETEGFGKVSPTFFCFSSATHAKSGSSFSFATLQVGRITRGGTAAMELRTRMGGEILLAAIRRMEWLEEHRLTRRILIT
jgi:hypothetical protein